MKKVHLSRIVEKLESGSREKGGSIDSGIISIGGTHLSNNIGFKWEKKEFVSEEFFLKMRSGKVKYEDILIVKDGATTGKTSFVDENFPFKEAAINEHVFRLEVNKELANPKYVFYFLHSPTGQVEILNDFRGATVGGISRGFINKVELPLPDLDTQNKIVAILDKAKAILDKREETIKQYDELLRATFLEMFGNPMERPNRWAIGHIRDYIIDIAAGVSYSGEDKKKLREDEIGILKVSAVTKGVFDPLEYKAVKRDIIKKEVLNPLKGDLLFSRANTLELVGATCIVHENYEDLALPDKLWKIETNEEELRKVFLHFVLRNKDVRKSFLSIATGSSGSMLNISMDKFKSIEIPLPPVILQLRFEAEYFKCIELRKKLLKHLELIKELKSSLSNLAFAGELKFEGGIELEVFLEKDFQFFYENINNISSKTIIDLLSRLDKNELSENRFYEQNVYDKAKSFVFELIKKGKVKQIFDEKSKKVKLTI